MRSVNALQKLAELSQSQWGMVTAPQAASLGVSRLMLARLADSGHLRRLAHGVYKDAGAAIDELDDLRAVWLSTEPRRLAEERLRDDPVTVVLSGATASWLHGIGDLPPEPYEFSTQTRRQTQRTELRYRLRRLKPSHITIRQGLPVTSIERTIADLVDDQTDLSLVADTVRDAAALRPLDRSMLADLLAPLAARNGCSPNDGNGLLTRLLQLARIDAESIADRIASTTLGSLVSSKHLQQLTASISSAPARSSTVPFDEGFAALLDAIGPGKGPVEDLGQLARAADGASREIVVRAPESGDTERLIVDLTNAVRAMEEFIEQSHGILNRRRGRKRDQVGRE
jgi:hypothetical protein